MSVAKVRASMASDALKFEGHGSFDNFITQAAGKEPYLSFTRSNDTAMPWYQLLSPFEQPSSNNISKGQKIEAGTINASEDNCNGITSLSESYGNIGGASTKISKSVGESSLKIPEAVVAFAQAAAKANGEPEKYLSGWPLLPSNKVQPQKCAKCSKEFYSSVNYKRHVRTHRKSNIYEKVSPNTREFLSAFWDKISADEARELMLFKDSSLDLEGVSAASIISELSSWIRKPGLSLLPRVYVKAGLTLSDIIQAKASRFPITSQELFGVLDDASENTFLCAGTASSLQKFLFDGDAAKTALEMKNLVACVSLLIEQKLVKAWHVDKDAEALRLQKLLVEEVEIEQRRQADLAEKRRRKKQRQKEQKVKYSANGNSGIKEAQEVCDNKSFVGSSTPRASDAELDSEASSASSQPLPTSHVLDLKVEIDDGQPDSRNEENRDHPTMQLNGQIDGRTTPNQRTSSNVFNSSQLAVVKCTLTEKNNVLKNSKGILSNAGQKVWTRKIKHESSEVSVYAQAPNESEVVASLKSSEKPVVVIGTISVSLGESVCSSICRDTQSDLSVKLDGHLNQTNKSVVKLWRPVSRQGDKDTIHEGSEADITNVCNEATSSSDLHVDCSETATSFPPDNSCSSDGGGDDFSSTTTFTSTLESTGSSASTLFSSQTAKVFLNQRWEEAVASDHVKLVLPSDAEPVDFLDSKEEGNCAEMDTQTPDYSGHGNCKANPVSAQQACGAVSQKAKLKPKPDKVCRVQYVPKQRIHEIER